MIRSGAIFWLACAQFFVMEQVVRLGWKLPYSFATNYVSDLGAISCTRQICSPWHVLMNGSFVLQGLLIAGGAVLTWKRWSSVGRIGVGLLMLCGAGVMVVGFVPEDANGGLHRLGAAVHFLGGGFGIMAVGWSMRGRFRWISFRMAMLILGATAALGSEGSALREPGAVECVAAYGIAGWMVLAGLWLRARRHPATRAEL